MSAELPEFYFRVKDNGALVFRVDSNNRNRRIEMDQIAVVNTNNGQIKPQGNHELSEDELTVIHEWMEERSTQLSARVLDDILRAVDHLNLTTQWVQSKASDEQLDVFTDQLLLAMHDLRSVLVRKKSERLLRDQESPQEG